MSSPLIPGSIPVGKSGQFLERLQLDGLEISLVSYPERMVIEEHSHERDYLCFTARGAFCERAGDNQSFECRSGEMIVKPSGVPHRDEFPVACTAINMEFEAWRSEELAGGKLRIERTSKFSGGRLSNFGFHLFHELQAADDLTPAVAEGLIISMLAECHRAGRDRGAGSLHVRKVLGIIEDMSPTVPGLGELAAEVRLHPSTLARTFKDATGKTIGEYGREIRIRKAQGLIAAGELRLAQIAIETGFNDQSHFTRAFKQSLGCTPGVYARAMRG